MTILFKDDVGVELTHWWDIHVAVSTILHTSVQYPRSFDAYCLQLSRVYSPYPIHLQYP
jgi:hypothetical protein